jgi:proton glutamate symport protein
VRLLAVNLIQPGVRQHIDPAKVAATPTCPRKRRKRWYAGSLNTPSPPASSTPWPRATCWQVVVFCFLFGTACVAVGEKAKFIVEWCESLAEVMFKYTSYVMYLAPLAVGAASCCRHRGRLRRGYSEDARPAGADRLRLARLLRRVHSRAHCLFVEDSAGPLIEAVKEPWLIAFSTASSEAALPKALENMERFGVPKHIVSFVLPTGYSFNLDGSTLYLAAASIFCAQVVGMELTVGTQVMLMLTLMLTSKGVAPVSPRLARHPRGHHRGVQHPARWDRPHSRRRCDSRHGPHLRQPPWQLPGFGRGGPLGGG